MILRSVTLEDFGLYAGRTDLDLVPRRKPGGPTPIVLIGGKNGAGKTTLLEAVRLALYGRRALGVRVGQSEYEDYLRGRINRSASPASAAVGLELDYAEAGVVHRYRVRREWAARGKSVIETLSLEKDGLPISSVPRDEWHHFLQELIPPGVSQLFFFDGEKISEIAEGDQDNEQLGEAVRGLLGIDLVGRLRVDLGLYLARHQRVGGSDLPARLEAVNRDISVAETHASVLADEVADLTAERDSQARAAEQMRRQFVAEGGDVAVHRDRMETDRDRVQGLVHRAEHELRDLAGKLLPFAFAPRLIRNLKGALLQASEVSAQRGSMSAVDAALQRWRLEGDADRAAAWEEAHWRDLAAFLHGQSAALSPATSAPALQELGDGTAALGRIAEIEAQARPRAVALLAQMDDLDDQARALRVALSRADNAAAGVLLDDLRVADQRVGATEERLHASQEQLKALRGRLVTLAREQRRLLEEQADTARSVDRSDLAVRAVLALADYEQRLLDQKLEQLRLEFVHRFNHLARKAELISDVRINPNTFATTLIDSAGLEVPKSSLSAGEKQIYAIAMLWALARTSGRALPMIIDTPLARLDSDHRANLLDRYFPSASHQVILLSTDTEVNADLYKALGANISHAYRLEYDPEGARTSVLPGYFEAPDDEGAHLALQQA